MCKVAKSTDGVHSAKFYWPNPNMVAFVVEAETGSWGIGAEPTGEAMKAFFDLGDAASCVMDETWVDASLGQKRSDRAGFNRNSSGGEGGILNPRTSFPVAGFQDQCFQPLSHLSLEEINFY